MGSKAISWSQLVRTLSSLRDKVQADDLVAFEMQSHEFHAMMFDLLNPETWPFWKHAEPPDERVATIADLEWQCANVQQSDLAQELASPRIFGKHRFILHAFSGRRRQGDFQFFLDAIADSHPGMVL